MRRDFTIAILVVAAVIAGCSRSDRLLESNDNRGSSTGMSTGSSGTSSFSDDFESGLDPAVWYCEMLGYCGWQHATEGGNGYVTSPAHGVWSSNNRFDDLLTQRSDFADFTFTWDMRFHNQSWHQDYRDVYFRCDDSPNPNGYVVQIGVWIPTIPDNLLQIYRHNPDDTGTLLHSAYVSYPWTLEEWYSFKLQVSGNRFNLKVWKKSDPEPAEWIIEAVDEEQTHASGRIGFGDYWNAVTDVDNVVLTAPLTTVGLDIRPGSCPNPLNIRQASSSAKMLKGGVLPVAILGSSTLDVASIDVASLRLEGIAPLRHGYEDVATPAGPEACDCTTLGADGYMDLTLKFDAAQLAAALAPLTENTTLLLQVTGSMVDGSPISGEDCVRIVPGPELE
jgi:hypothetical protein